MLNQNNTGKKIPSANNRKEIVNLPADIFLTRLEPSYYACLNQIEIPQLEANHQRYNIDKLQELISKQTYLRNNTDKLEEQLARLGTYHASRLFMTNQIEKNPYARKFIYRTTIEKQYKTNYRILLYMMKGDMPKANELASELLSIEEVSASTTEPQLGKRKHGQLFHPGEDTEKTARARIEQKGSCPSKKITSERSEKDYKTFCIDNLSGQTTYLTSKFINR